MIKKIKKRARLVLDNFGAIWNEGWLVALFWTSVEEGGDPVTMAVSFLLFLALFHGGGKVIKRSDLQRRLSRLKAKQNACFHTWVNDDRGRFCAYCRYREMNSNTEVRNEQKPEENKQ